MLFGVWRGKLDDRELGLRGRVVEWCSCVDKDDDEERKTDVAVYVDLGMVNAGEEMSWPSRSGGAGHAQGQTHVRHSFLGLGKLAEYRHLSIFFENMHRFWLN
jgi:hypothetical protein